MKNILILLSIFFGLAGCTEKQEIDLSGSIFQLNSKWEDQTGKEIQLEELKGKTLVMVMIYTTCKTACPRLTIEMREIERSVGDYDPKKIRFVLVSIDPEHDTPERMKTYLENNKFLGEQWLFLRSDEASTREFANVLSVKYDQISPVDFSHSNIISIFSENGVLAYQKEGLNTDIENTTKEIKKQLN